MAEIETRGKEVRGLLKEAIRRSVVLIVVICPLPILWWRVSEHLPIGKLTLGLYVAVAGLLILCEQTLAFNKEWGSAIRGNKTDFLYVIAATLVEKASFVVCVTAVASVGAALSSHFQIDLWPSTWGFVFQVVLALLIADVAAYLRHRLFHRSSFLWRFHAIHHSVTGLYWIRSAYTHPLEQFCIMAAIMLPVALLGAGAEIIAAIAFLFGLSGLLQHANIDSRSSVLNYVFATPEVHRVHHIADDRANHSNFSAFFVLMDHIFGSYCRPAHSEDPVRIGLEGVTAFPGDFLSHLVMPFKRHPPGLVVDDVWAQGRGEVSEAKIQ